ncbi:MAG: hypothetical protein ACI8PP_003170 [Candidatus Pseudothioglobus sp.]|jgi:hypothetical protein
MTNSTDNVIYIHGAQTQSRRRHIRTNVSGRVVAQVLKADDPGLVGHTFHSSIVEISRCGMRLMAAIPLDGCTLDLFVKIDGLSRTMLLKTEVRWVSQEDSGDYMNGAEICDTSTSDTDAWYDFQRDLKSQSH